MEQKFKILLNRNFSAYTESRYIPSEKYILTKETIPPSNIVAATNVRGYLAENSTSKMVVSFFAFLTGSSLMNSTLSVSQFTPTPRFKEIYYDDTKLSNTFNDYYNSAISNANIISNSEIITNQVPCESCFYETINTYENLFNWGGNLTMPLKDLNYIPLDFVLAARNVTPIENIVTTDDNEGYYITAFLNKSTSLIAVENYLFCEKKLNKTLASTFLNHSSSTINVETYPVQTGNENLFTTPIYESDDAITIDNYNFTETPVGQTPEIYFDEPQIEQCFIDLNLDLNENDLYADHMPMLTFETDYNQVNFGWFHVKVMLDQPSLGGEIFSINNLFPYSSIIGASDFQSIPPATHQFNIGETYKTLWFQIDSTCPMSDTESFKIKLINLVNAEIGIYPETKVDINRINAYEPSVISFTPTWDNDTIDVGGVPYVKHDSYLDGTTNIDLSEFTDVDIAEGAQFVVRIGLDAVSELCASSVKLKFDKGTTFDPSETEDDWTVVMYEFDTSGNYTTTTFLDIFNSFYTLNFADGEQTKTLAFQFPMNDDIQPGETEYFDISLFDLENLTAGEFLNTRLFIHDVVEGSGDTPNPFGFCSIPDYYYTDLGELEVDPSIQTAAILNSDATQFINLSAGTKGPRFKGYLVDGCISPSYRSDDVLGIAYEYEEFDVVDLHGQAWTPNSDSLSIGGTLPPFSFNDDNIIAFSESYPNCYGDDHLDYGVSHSIQKVTWYNKKETKLLCNCKSGMLSLSENTQEFEMQSGTIVNGLAPTLTNSQGPPVSAATKGDQLVYDGEIIYNGLNTPITHQQLVTQRVGCDCSNAFSSPDDGTFLGSPGFRFLIKAKVITINSAIMASRLRDEVLDYNNYNDYINGSTCKLAVFYLTSGLRKPWTTLAGYESYSTVYSSTVQKRRKIDDNGDIWEWCFRFTSLIPANAAVAQNIEWELKNSTDTGYKSGWGWFRMMNVVSGHVYEGEEIMTVNGVEVDGTIFDFNAEEGGQENIEGYSNEMTDFLDLDNCITPEMVNIVISTDLFDLSEYASHLPADNDVFYNVVVNGQTMEYSGDSVSSEFILTVPKHSSVDISSVYLPLGGNSPVSAKYGEMSAPYTMDEISYESGTYAILKSSDIGYEDSTAYFTYQYDNSCNGIATEMVSFSIFTDYFSGYANDENATELTNSSVFYKVIINEVLTEYSMEDGFENPVLTLTAPKNASIVIEAPFLPYGIGGGANSRYGEMSIPHNINQIELGLGASTYIALDSNDIGDTNFTVCFSYLHEGSCYGIITEVPVDPVEDDTEDVEMIQVTLTEDLFGQTGVFCEKVLFWRYRVGETEGVIYASEFTNIELDGSETEAVVITVPKNEKLIVVAAYSNENIGDFAACLPSLFLTSNMATTPEIEFSYSHTDTSIFDNTYEMSRTGTFPSGVLQEDFTLKVFYTDYN